MRTRKQVGILGAALLFSVGMVSTSPAQELGAKPAASKAGPDKPPTDAPSEVKAASKTSEGKEFGLVGRFVDDQRRIWTAPAGLRFSDTQWLVPLSGLTAGLMVTDSDFNRSLSHDPKTINRYNNLSNASVAALVGGAGGMWLLSHETHNEHWRETGFLSGEAALNSLGVAEGMK